MNGPQSIHLKDFNPPKLEPIFAAKVIYIFSSQYSDSRDLWSSRKTDPSSIV